MAKQIITSVAQLEAQWAKDFREKFSSSAKNLETALLKKGIIPAVKIYHDYILLDNLKPEEFEKRLKNVWLHLIFKTNRVKLFFDINNSTLEEMEKMYNPYLSMLNNWVRDIKIKNPDLKDINAQTVDDKLALVDGVCYGFNPIDIKEFINNKTNIKNINTMEYERGLEKIIGGSISYRMAAENIKKIVESVKKQNEGDTKQCATYDTKQCATDDFDTLDPTGFLRFMQGRDDDF